MRVRYVGARSTAGARADHRALEVGTDYVVYAVRIRPERTWLMLLVEHNEPGWFDAADFDLVSDEVPSNWRILIGAADNAPSEFDFAPDAWLRPGFLKDYWSDGGPAATDARAIFEQEAEIILRESR